MAGEVLTIEPIKSDEKTTTIADVVDRFTRDIAEQLRADFLFPAEPRPWSSAVEAQMRENQWALLMIRELQARA